MLTVDYVKEFMRIDTDEEDGYLSVLLILAKEFCENYLRCDLPEPLPETVKQAELLVISHFYENRNGTPIPDTVYRLLDAYRKEVF